MSKKRKAIHPRARFLVLQRDNFKCKYCGASAETTELQIDHVVPVCLGGTNELSNLVACCSLCNLGKSAMPLDQAVGAEK